MYGKLFGQMYDGTIVQSGWRAIVTFQQMIILADAEGVVDMTADAITRRTTIPLEIIEEGLRALALPDPDSRSSDEGGRRIVLLRPDRTWGWRLVNYAHYRHLRNEEQRTAQRREYHREYKRAHRAGEGSGQPACQQLSTAVNSCTPMSTMSPYAESESESESKAKKKRPTMAIAGAALAAFEVFWLAWPRKEKRQEAMKAWRQVGGDQPLAERLASHLAERVRTSVQWQDPSKVPHPATFLRGRMWEDEYPKLGAGTAELFPRRETPAAQRDRERAAFAADAAARRNAR